MIDWKNYSSASSEVEKRITKVEYETRRQLGGAMCVITMWSGWAQTGFCPLVMPDGKKTIEEAKQAAYDQAFHEICQHEMYLARALRSLAKD